MGRMKVITESNKIEKEAKILAEEKRLSAVFTKIPARSKRAMKSLIHNAAFMAVTLSDLQDTINADGPVSEYQNGENQWGTKKSPEIEIYNTMIKNHASIIKQLTDLLPPEEAEKNDDEFEGFVEGGK